MMSHSTPNIPVACRRGFSFVEVMFAVIILGIGFIMVTAIFPVAIQQTQLNVDETAATRISQAANANLTAMTQDLLKLTETANPAVTTWSYGWPMTVNQPATNVSQAGKVFSFRDPRIGGIAPSFPASTVVPAPLQFPLPSTGVLPLQYPIGLWDMVRGNMISSTEPQYAYVPLFQRGYKRDPTAGALVPKVDGNVNFFVFIAVARNRTPYSYIDFNNPNGPHSDVLQNPTGANNDTSLDGANPPASLEPRLVQVQITPRNGGQIVDQIMIQASTVAPAGGANSWLAAGTGGFVVISDDGGTGTFNGRTYRLGANIASTSTSNTWELQIGSDVAQSDLATFPTGIAMQAFILGRELQNPDAPYSATNVYDGPVQDAAMQTFPITAP